jgi:hypothetical protein
VYMISKQSSYVHGIMLSDFTCNWHSAAGGMSNFAELDETK